MTLAPRPPRVVSFEVGLGDAILVEGRSGSLLVDAGIALPDGFDFGERVVVPALRALGVRSLDVVVASHGDADHRGGLPAVLEAFPVGELWLPPGGLLDPDFSDLLATARARRVPVVERARGDRDRRFGDLEIAALWPPRDGLRRSRNDASLVLRVEVAGHRILLTGDIGAAVEAALLERESDLSAEVLKVAHHGSRTASTQAFLDAVSADVALLSAPCAARAALPAAATLRRLRRAGSAVWWTGRSGAAVVALDRGAGSPVAWGWLTRSRGDCLRAPR